MTTVHVTEDMIGKYINEYLWTDVNPIGKIVGIVGKTGLILQRVIATRDESVKMNYIPGGFSAHCTNNYAQKWNFSVDETETFKIRLSKGMLRRRKIEEHPRCFYDYNF